MYESEMETMTTDLPNFPVICRICLGTEGLQLFYEEYLMDVFKTITSIEVESDGFPLYICKVCLQKLEEITDFGDMARYNNTEYKKTWMRRKRLKENTMLVNQQKDTEGAFFNNHTQMIDEARINNHRRMKEQNALLNEHGEMTTNAAFPSIYSEKKNETLLLDSDSNNTNDAVISNDHTEPPIKTELFNIYSETTKEEVLLDPDSEMINPLSNNYSDATVKLELADIDSDIARERVLLNEAKLMNKLNSTTQVASVFSGIFDSTCSSNLMDQNSGVVTITDTESESESRDVSFVSQLQGGNFTGGTDRPRNPNRPRKPRRRHVYSRNEILELEKEFVIDPFTTGSRRADIAASLGISQVQVKVWFQNRRMKQRKEEEKIKRMNGEEWKKQMAPRQT